MFSFCGYSAGIGRTGTFIDLDYLLEEGTAEHTIDVKGYIIALRHQKGKSIQTFVSSDIFFKYNEFISKTLFSEYKI